MNPKAFFNQLDHDRMVTAIVEAEKQTSGEICVYVSRRKVNDVQSAALHQFHQLGMHRTWPRYRPCNFVPTSLVMSRPRVMIRLLRP